MSDLESMTGYIPTDLYNDFLKNKDLYDKLGKPYPVHYVDFGGIAYQVSYGDPYTIIGYFDNTNAPVDPPDVIATPDQVALVFSGGGVLPPSTFVPKKMNRRAKTEVAPGSALVYTPQIPLTGPSPSAPATGSPPGSGTGYTYNPPGTTKLPPATVIKDKDGLPAASVTSPGGFAGIGMLALLIAFAFAMKRPAIRRPAGMRAVRGKRR